MLPPQLSFVYNALLRLLSRGLDLWLELELMHVRILSPQVRNFADMPLLSFFNFYVCVLPGAVCTQLGFSACYAFGSFLRLLLIHTSTYYLSR